MHTPCYAATGYKSLRRCLRLRQNPPACALWASCVTWFRHCSSVIGFSSSMIPRGTSLYQSGIRSCT